MYTDNTKLCVFLCTDQRTRPFDRERGLQPMRNYAKLCGLGGEMRNHAVQAGKRPLDPRWEGERSSRIIPTGHWRKFPPDFWKLTWNLNLADHAPAPRFGGGCEVERVRVRE